MTITSLKSALQRIAQLEQENEQLRAELEANVSRTEFSMMISSS